MKKNFFFSALVAAEIFLIRISFAQNTFPSSGNVGIGTTTPNASSLLEVKSTTQGALIPRMTKSQRDAIAAPAEGLLVYVTDKKPGIYYYEGGWTAAKGANPSLSNLASSTAVNVDLLPGAGNTSNLGSSGFGWKDLYLTGSIYLNGTKFTFNAGTTSTAVGFHTGGGGNNDNSSFGYQALYSNLSGDMNTGDGSEALAFNNNGSNNTATGYYALFNNSSGSFNTGDGADAGSNVSSGNDNTFIGANANCGLLGTLNNSTAIGYGASITTSNNMVLGNSDVVGWGFGIEAGSRAIKVGSTSSNGNGAYLTTGGTWTNTSARNKKEDFQKQDHNSILDKINQLEVTKWKYKGTSDEYHYGPMADDFHRLFEVGDDSSTSDMDKTGVLFLGMQALSEENKSLRSAVYSLQKENAEMKNQIAKFQSSIVNRESSTTDGYAKLQTSNFEPQTLLGQNIPNPFDNSTLIPFRIPKDCNDASIMITNTSSGEVISVIPISCNEDHVSIDAGMLASGTYSYTLYVDGKMIDTKSMVLTR